MTLRVTDLASRCGSLKLLTKRDLIRSLTVTLSKDTCVLSSSYISEGKYKKAGCLKKFSPSLYAILYDFVIARLSNFNYESQKF